MEGLKNLKDLINFFWSYFLCWRQKGVLFWLLSLLLYQFSFFLQVFCGDGFLRWFWGSLVAYFFLFYLLDVFVLWFLMGCLLSSVSCIFLPFLIIFLFPSKIKKFILSYTIIHLQYFFRFQFSFISLVIM